MRRKDGLTNFTDVNSIAKKDEPPGLTVLCNADLAGEYVHWREGFKNTHNAKTDSVLPPDYKFDDCVEHMQGLLS